MADYPGGKKTCCFVLSDRYKTIYTTLRHPFRSIAGLSSNAFTQVLIFILILSVGIFARTWQFNQLPPGLNQDEASIGIDAYNIVHFGIDRNGFSYPVNFVSWGDGQNALYGYILMPFIAVGGLTPFVVRLPMLISGILTLPLVYFIAKRTFNNVYALIAMFLLAISPWHIVLSRWGLESNILPFIFALGYICLMKSSLTNKWFILACLFFALCLYAYGTTYAAVPLFMLIMIPVLLGFRKVSRKNLIIGIISFALVGLPIALLILINTMHWNTIHIGIFSIPRYPIQARYETLTPISNTESIRQFLRDLKHNLHTLFSLLLNQDDGLIANTVSPFGYFYRYTFPLAIIGGIMALYWRKSNNRMGRLLLLGWLAASVLIGLLIQININRINLIFIPLFLCMAFPLEWLWKHLKALFILSIITLLVAFSFFTYTYHGAEYRHQADGTFFTGLLPALDFARQEGNNPICVTDKVNMPYIFALFSEKMDPKLYLNNIRYESNSRQVISLGRYTFGENNCSRSLLKKW